MPAREPFSYAVLRVVPRVERGERFNAGVVMFCRTLGPFLAARTELDEGKLRVLAPDLDPRPVREHLRRAERLAAGDPEAGPLAALPPSERFGALVAPASTVLQPGAVHTGLCAEPGPTLARLFAELVSPGTRGPA